MMIKKDDMTPKWPEKKEVPEGTVGELSKYDYENGWNDCLKACKKAYEESGQTLVPLDRGALQEVILPYSSKAFDIAYAICERFGTPPVPTLAPLDEDKLFDFLFQRGLTVSKFRTNELDMLVKEICAKFGTKDSGLVPLDEEKFFKLLSGYHGGNPEWWINELQRLWNKDFSKLGTQTLTVEEIQNILALNLSARNDGTVSKAAKAIYERLTQ